MIKKFIFGFLIYSVLPVVAQILQISFGWIPQIVAIIFLLVTVMPEILLVFPTYRQWVKEGIENADGKLEVSDIVSFLGYYGTFSIFRAFIFGYIMSMIGAWSPEPEILYAPLLGAGGGGLINAINQKRKEK